LSWLDLDGFLLRAFDLPWARGSVLRLSIGRRSVSLIVVDISTGFGAPETLCLVLDSNGTIRRTSETIRRIRTRIIDPGSLPSLAAHRRQFGVRDLDEPIPYRVRLLGQAPAAVEVVGRRSVAAATAHDASLSWSELGATVPRGRPHLALSI
jgi:hypothetical protein